MKRRATSHRWMNVVLGIFAAVVVPVAVAVAVAAPKVFTSGTAISSADVNANFDGVEKRLAALEEAAAPTGGRFTNVEQRLAKLEGSLTVGAWTAVAIAPNAPIDAWPDDRYGTGLSYKNVGPLTCLRGLLRANAANFFGTLAILPAGARPPLFIVTTVASSFGGTQLQIGTEGNMSLRDTPVPSGSWISFAGLCFPNQ